MGLRPHPRRVAQAGSCGLGDSDSQTLTSQPHRSSPAEIAPDLEGVLASTGFGDRLTDFLSVDTVLLKRLYVLIYMELATRRVIWFAVTDRPDAVWVSQ